MGKTGGGENENGQRGEQGTNLYIMENNKNNFKKTVTTKLWKWKSESNYFWRE